MAFPVPGDAIEQHLNLNQHLIKHPATNTLQGNLFAMDADPERDGQLMQAMDQINRKLGKDAVKFGALGLTQAWRMGSDYFSQPYTTPWAKLPTARIQAEAI